MATDNTDKGKRERCYKVEEYEEFLADLEADTAAEKEEKNDATDV